jgi:hypothetical protein
MAQNRYESRKRAAPVSSLVLGVRPIFLAALVLAGVVVLWVLYTLLSGRVPAV